MPNIAQAIKAEISRISRKEVKASVNPLRSSVFILKRTVAELRRKAAALEAENKRFSALLKDRKLPQVSPEEARKARVTSKSVKALRAKLGISQESLAKLLSISSQAVYAMEKKGARLRLRPATLAGMLALRQVGKREIRKRLEELSGK